jgi:hypothetical protein
MPAPAPAICSWRWSPRASTVFHYTEKHASWLELAKIEIDILDRRCLDRRPHNRTLLAAEVAAWQLRRNAEGRGIAWNFTRQDADRKMGKHHASSFNVISAPSIIVLTLTQCVPSAWMPRPAKNYVLVPAERCAVRIEMRHRPPAAHQVVKPDRISDHQLL